MGGLRQAAAKLLPRAGRGRPTLPFNWGAQAPRELAPDPCTLPHQLWGRSSCLNPVPQERHLLVIGTMEMAGLVLDLVLGSEHPRRQKGDKWGGVGQDSGLLCHLSLSLAIAAPTRSKPAKSKV